MGKREQKDQVVAEESRSTERTTDQTARRRQAVRQQKPRAPEPVTAHLIKLLPDHYFPNFNQSLSYMNMKKNYLYLQAAAMRKLGDGSWARARRECGILTNYRLQREKRSE